MQGERPHQDKAERSKAQGHPLVFEAGLEFCESKYLDTNRVL
jgi:hypothetical protein